MGEKIIVGLEIDKSLKDQLKQLADEDKRSQTFHLEKALTNYFISKKIIVTSEEK